jgi:HlyD family secretion protein
MSTPKWNACFPLFIGALAVILLLGGLGLWSVGTEIAGAVVAPGVVEVENERQVVQHPDGGVVAEILARDGDEVAAGAILVRFDRTFLASELQVVERQIAEVSARRARLVAERDGAQTPTFERGDDFVLVEPGEVVEQIAGQRSLFLARRSSMESELAQLAQQQLQITRQIEGSVAQQEALRRQKSYISQELGGLQQLLDDGLVQASRVLSLQREDARLSGEVGRLTAAIGDAETRASELEVERTRLKAGRREDAITELRALEVTEIELAQSRNRLTEQLSRMDVRAPVSGIVFGSNVAALNSVVRPADPMLYIVPGGQPMNVVSRIDPVDVDQIYPGQPVNLVFSAFNRRTTPEAQGVIVGVSADARSDDTTGATYFEATIRPDDASLADLGALTLLPGMPVETFIKTQDRTPLSYLLQPVSEYFKRAFRED